jgi:hypothetical protein
MSRLSTTRKSSLLAITLGLTAIGSTTIPAAAHPGVGSTLSAASPLASMPHPSGGFAGGAAGALKQMLPASSTISHTVTGNLSNAAAHVIGQKAPGPIGKAAIGNLNSPARVAGQATTTADPKAKATIGDLESPAHVVVGQAGTPPKGPMGVKVIPLGNGNGKDVVYDLCRFNRLKCSGQGLPTSDGSSPPAPQNPGSTPSMPGSPGYPPGGMSGSGIAGTISGVLSGVMSGGSGPVDPGQTAPVAVPTPVIQPPRVVTGAPRPWRASPATA